MNIANNFNPAYPKAFVSLNPEQPCRKHQDHQVVTESIKTRLFRLQQAPEKPPLLEQVLKLLQSHGFQERDFRIGITGFGEIKTHLAEIGLVSTAPGFYNLHIGGNRAGNQLNKIYSINVSESTLLDALNELIVHFKIARQPGEKFGEFVNRKEII